MMKTIKGIISSVWIIILALGNAQAQSHTKAAPNCVYAKDYYASLPKNNKSPYVSCVDCYCKACGVKQAKELEKKQQEEKQAIGKRKMQAEKRQQEQAKNIQQQKEHIARQRQKARENEIVLVAPKVKTEQSSTTVTPKSPRTNPGNANLKAWQARFVPRNNEAGFGYYDESANWVWKLQTPNFKSHRDEGFEENSEYAPVKIGGDGNNRMTSSCGTTYYPTISGIINRTGELVKQGAAGSDFIMIAGTPFAIEIESFSYEPGGGEGCAARILNIKTGKYLKDLSANMSYKHDNSNRVNCTSRAGIMYFRKGQKHQYYSRYQWIETNPAFTENLNKQFDSGNYQVCLLYADRAFKQHEGATAFFFGKDGSFREVRESWVTEFMVGGK